MECPFRPAVWLTVLFTAFAGRGLVAQSFGNQWSYASENSAVVYWRDANISHSASSWVEYGNSSTLGRETEHARRSRWAHLHHLDGFAPGDTIYYRMVEQDTLTGAQWSSSIQELPTAARGNVIRIPEDVSGPTYMLDQAGAYYILTRDITTPGTAVQINAVNITLDLNGHTVTFGDDTDSQVFGVRFACPGGSTLCNGYIKQGARSGSYSCAIRSTGRPYATEIFGISTDVYLRCAYPINFLNNAKDLDLHHNEFYSRVIDIDSRQYPGNALVQVYTNGGNIHIHDNLVTEGCHRGIYVSDNDVTAPNVEIDHNDVQHHQQYVNGYAIIPTCAGADVHDNRITSVGRGMHLTRPDVQVHNNYIDIKGHMHLDDVPSNQDALNFDYQFQRNLIELHGIKFEGSAVTGCRIYDNYVKVTQKLPVDFQGQGDPADKMLNGIYYRSNTGVISGSTLTEQSPVYWPLNRWKDYYVKYDPGLPSAKIGGSDRNSLLAAFQGGSSGEYTIYMPWKYVPATPLNIDCGTDAKNEVYNNTFVGTTEYDQTWHGGYGDSGQWATGIMFVSMNKDAASQNSYAIRIYNNQFICNDLFLNSYEEVTQTVRLENNAFELVNAPKTTERTSRFRLVGSAVESVARGNGNTFMTQAGSFDPDINGDGSLSLLDVLHFMLQISRQPSNPSLDWNGDGKTSAADVLLVFHEITKSRGLDK